MAKAKPFVNVVCKRGAISTEEVAFIKQAIQEGLSDEQIAKKLNRNVSFVTKHKKRLTPTGLARFNDLSEVQEDVKDKLNNSKSWASIKEELTDKELAHFIELYSQMMSQFRGDVTATEENQAKQAAKLDILMARELINRRKIEEKLEELEFELAEMKAYEDMEPEEKARQQQVRELIANYRSGSAQTYTQYVNLQKQHESLTKLLKLSRDQRINKVDDMKVSWTDIIKKLNEEENRDTIGHVMEKGKKVYKKELGRLSEPHIFTNGTVDQPILSVETYAGNEDEVDSTDETSNQED